MTSNVIPIRPRTALSSAALVTGLIALVVILGALLLPSPAHAQTGDPTIDAVLAYVPARFWVPLFAAWAALYYVVCPLVLWFVKITEQSGAAARWAVRISEYITQNTHRPPPLGKPPASGSNAGGAAVMALLLAFGLGSPSLARAAEAQPAASPTAPLAVQLTPDLSLRLNVSIVAGSYDLTHKAWLGQGQIGGLYALTSKRLLEAGVIAGGSVSFDTSSRPLGELNAGFVSPKLPISPALALHGAVLYGRRFGPDAANLFRFCPTLEF